MAAGDWHTDDLAHALLPQGNPDPVLIVRAGEETADVELAAMAAGRRVIASRHVPPGYAYSCDLNDLGAWGE